MSASYDKNIYIMFTENKTECELFKNKTRVWQINMCRDLEHG